ncbi:hypothetical protein [Ornithinimicrobium sp. Y1694]|uniref:hypothetical protein n=1 Tax=Ornithinimicrobium sp. Y1694 TaxID=3418590 RepID=UPI003CEF5B6F
MATAALVGAGLLATAAPAQAGDLTCRTSIGARTIDGNVIVPAGATCKLTGTKVKGNVLVRSNANVYLDKARIDGNVQAVSHNRVDIRNRSVIEQHGRRRHPVLQQPGRHQDHQLQHGRREPAVQEQHPGPDRQGQQGGRQQGRPVPQPLSAHP